MTGGIREQEGQRAGLDDDERRAMIRVDGSAKANLGPPEKARWVRLVGVALPNGDEVAAAEQWKWPDPFDGLTADDLSKVQRALDGKAFRASSQAQRWAGHEVGKVLGFDTTTKAGAGKAKRLLAEWVRTGALVAVKARDPEDRKDRPLIEVGQWVGK